MPPVQPDNVQVGSDPIVTNHSNSESDSDIMAVAPEKFDGHMDPTDWLDDLVAYTNVKKLDDLQAGSMARFLFTGNGLTWYKTLPRTDRDSFIRLASVFEAYWVKGPKRPDLGLKLRQLTSAKQKSGQSVPDFVIEVLALAKDLHLDDDNLLRVIQSGLKPEFLPFFRQANPKTPQDVIKCEALQVAATTSSSGSVDQGLLKAIDELLTAKIAALGVAAPRGKKKTTNKTEEENSPYKRRTGLAGRLDSLLTGLAGRLDSLLTSKEIQRSFWFLSGGFTPCRHLRPSSGREHTIVLLIQSGDDDYLMNETRRKPTTRRQSPSLCDKWHGIFYMPSRIDDQQAGCHARFLMEGEVEI